MYKEGSGFIWYLLTDDDSYVLVGEEENETLILAEATTWEEGGKNQSDWTYKSKS